MVEIKNLNFKYENNAIFENLNLILEDHTWYTLVGKNGVGKTTLVKIMAGLLNAKYVLLYNNKKINKLNDFISVVFEEPLDNFMFDKVIDELRYPLLSLGISEDEINTRINNILSILGINNLINTNIELLNNSEKQKISLALALVTTPKLLILDNAFTFIPKDMKEKLLIFLKQLDIIILNVTNNIEETLYGDNIIILADKKIVINDKKGNVFLNEAIFSSNNIHLPFIIDLSFKLKYYGLLDKLCYSNKEVVDSIWK